MDRKQCPNQSQLQHYALGTLSHQDVEDVESHLLRCLQCTEVFAMLEQSATDDLTNLLRESTPDPEDTFLTEPRFRQLVEELSGLTIADALQPVAAGVDDVVLERGRRLGQYEIIEVIGRGGVGIVYKALHLKLKRPVALKVLRNKRLNNPDVQRRFEREMQAIAKLDHPHIVRALDADVIDGIHFLVMEFVPGSNLSAVLRMQGPLKTEYACSLITQAARGLQHVYENGFVHRDLKPANLLLSDDGIIKIVDLGLAGLIESAEPPTQQSSHSLLLGTLDFIAPEQTAEGRSIDICADVYSLGATLFALLTGAAPFAHRQYSSILTKIGAIATETAPQLAEIRTDAPPELDAVVAKMLRRAPEERYQSPTEVVEALRPFSRETTDGDFTAPIHKPVVDAHARRKWHWGILLIAVLATFFLAVGLLVISPSEQSKTISHTLGNDVGPDFVPIKGAEPAGKVADDGGATASESLSASSTATSAITRANRIYLQFTASPNNIDLLRDLLEPASDETVRTYVISRLALEGISPAQFMKWVSLEGGTDAADDSAEPMSPGVCAAILLAFGDAAGESVASNVAVRSKLLHWYLSDPDPAVHSAIERVLQRAGLDDVLNSAKALLQQKLIPRNGGWYETVHGHTMVVIPPTGPQQLGSPVDEPGRFTEKPLQNEALRNITIDYSFAVATKEVTREQFHGSGLPATKLSSPDEETPGLPQNEVTWNQAAAYCNWLSHVEGLPLSELCYTKIEGTQDFRCKDNATHLSGYRLPTDEEWEVAARGGTPTIRHFGNAAEMMSAYGFVKDSASGVVQRVGSLRPNNFGLFDTLGNVSEWIHSRIPDGPKRILRRLRGGSAWTRLEGVRSAARYYYRHDQTSPRMGFRVVRTILPQSQENRRLLTVSVGPPVGLPGDERPSMIPQALFTPVADTDVIRLGSWERGVVPGRKIRLRNDTAEPLVVKPGWVGSMYGYRNFARTVLSPSDTMEFDLAIDPEFVGPRPGKATVEIEKNGQPSELTLNLSASVSGAKCAVLELEDHAHSQRFQFGTIPLNSTIRHTFSIWNQGNRPLRLIDVGVPDGFQLEKVPDGEIVSSGFGHVTVSVNTDEVGLRSGVLTIESSDGLHPVVGIPIEARVAESPYFSRIGVYRNGLWLFDHDFDGESDEHIYFGEPGDVPVTGDWNGDGICDIGVCRKTPAGWQWNLQFRGQSSPKETWESFFFGDSDSIPLAGHRFADSPAKPVAVNSKPSGQQLIWKFRLSAKKHAPELTQFLNGTYAIGDWDGDGIDDKAIIDSGDAGSAGNFRWKIYVNSEAGAAKLLSTVELGAGVDTPVVGDWNGDGRTNIGVFRTVNGDPAEWLFDTDGKGGIHEREARFGRKGDVPVVLSQRMSRNETAPVPTTDTD